MSGAGQGARAAAVVVAAALSAVGPAAVAQPRTATSPTATRPAPRYAVSLSLPALSVRSVAAGVERNGLWGLLDRRFSAVVIAGVRRGASGDYSSTTLATGLELRYWLTGTAPWSRWQESRAMVGAFAGLRLGLAHTGTHDDVDDRRIGSTLIVSESAHIGYRFAILGRVEITPSIGMQLRHEFELDSRLPPWTRGGLLVGLTVGVLW